MGYFLLILAKLCCVGKIIAMKACGSTLRGLRNSVRINLFRTAICLAVSFFVCLVAGFVPCSPKSYLFIIGSGAATGVELVSWVLAVQGTTVCQLGVAGMIGSVAVPMLLAPFLFRGESVSWLGWVGMLLLFVAVFLFSPRTEHNEKRKLTPQTFFYMFCNAVGSCANVIFQKLYAVEGGDIAYFNLLTFSVTFLFLTVFVFLLKIFQKKESSDPGFAGILKNRTGLLIIAAAVFLYAYQFLFTRSAGLLSSGIFYPLSYALGMGLNYLCDITLYHEKVTLRNLCGIAAVLLSCILICL